MIKRLYFWGAILLAALLLGSCSFGERRGAQPEGDNSSLPPLSAAATPYRGPEATVLFNETAESFLLIDGEGAFRILSPGMSLAGTYTATESELSLFCEGEELRSYPGGGGYVIAGMAGHFLPTRELSAFAELGLIRRADREYSSEEGSYRLSDYSLQLALRYPETMSAPENLITDAVVVWDGGLGYVSGRNVTADFAGEAEKYMESYMRERVLGDFRLLYGEEGSMESLELLQEGVSGRLASAEAVISGGENRIYVKCIMYTSTYSDGTANYICKCFFAPEGDVSCFNTLANSVVNMTAVRRR